ncbi:MAG: hypothetical protein U9O78_03140 [Patescibacteria group bacterium]|nr:hypothetical protein [Patescibacteria group bacterium]
MKSIDKSVKTYLAFFLCLFAFLNAPTNSPTLAQETNEASPSTKESLKERIDKVVEEKKEQVKDKVEEFSQKKRGFIGRIDRVSEEAITLENRKGTQIIPFNDELALTKNNDEVSVEDLAVDDWVTVLGFQEETNFSPIKLIVSEDDLNVRPQIVEIGSIVDFDQKQVTIKTRDGGSEIEFQIKKTTLLEDSNSEEFSTSDLFEDMQCLIAGYKDIDEDEDDDVETNVAIIFRSLAPIQ